MSGADLPTLAAARFGEALELLGEEIDEAILEFRDLALADLQALRTATAAADPPAVAAAAHRLAGASMTLGAPRLAALAEAIEERAAAGHLPAPAELAGLAAEVTAVHAAMSAAAGGGPSAA